MITRQLSVITTSADLAAALSDETGTGLAVFNTNPTIDGLTVKTGTDAGLVLRSLVGGTTYGAMYSTNVTPSATNFLFAASATTTAINNATSVGLQISNTVILNATSTGVAVLPTTASTSTITGSLTVAGGVGVAGALYVGGGVALNGGVTSLNSAGSTISHISTGALGIHAVAFGGNGNIVINAANTFSNFIQVNSVTVAQVSSTGVALSPTTASTSTTTGALTVAGGVGVAGALVVGATIKSGGYTVATLPAGTTGDRAYVTDATAPTFNGALTGGGAVEIPVFKNSTAWVSA